MNPDSVKVDIYRRFRAQSTYTFGGTCYARNESSDAIAEAVAGYIDAESDHDDQTYRDGQLVLAVCRQAGVVETLRIHRRATRLTRAALS